MRGLAALVVVFRHAFNAIEMPVSRQHEFFASPLALFLNAQGAVQLFFVLSGFVLAGSLARSPGVAGRASYVVRRLFRIYPPYAAALFCAIAASFAYAPMSSGSGVSAWMNHFLEVRFDPAALLGYLLLPGQAGQLLDVGWTLRIELLASFLLPIMLLAATRLHWSVLLVFCLPLFLGEAWRTTWYLIDFALGLVIYLERHRLRDLFDGISGIGALAFVSLAVFLFVAPMWSTNSAVLVGRLAPGYRPMEIAVLGLGSAGLIVASLCLPGLGRFLRAGPILFLGRISFSLYLLHKTILHLLVPLFAPYEGLLPVVFLYVALVGTSLVAAALGHALIEEPAIRLGRRAARSTSSFVSRRILKAPSA